MLKISSIYFLGSGTSEELDWNVLTSGYGYEEMRGI